ncbi:MAG: hypothetical protein R3C24_07480 [Cyanobacteriota/Melainabacteria group bacterium]
MTTRREPAEKIAVSLTTASIWLKPGAKLIALSNLCVTDTTSRA